ncbi:CobW family GTP-binding protein [Marinobacterium rhizophilum]|uniref:GTP-binding protein n=1 Tax=Marinobacterium rhizophilum TaxID=420402 RepID=A0ABY5HHA1_9GAMM|nr:GTP-binding protein [Marinobacterium rhizophilum]UTW11728.1 GTP-binding protein [Marinobacterium rhizophilum]
MSAATDFDVIPVHVLTGFLGSGKTSLLSRLLASEAFGDTAVLVNEFGEVGLDHLLLGEVAPDTLLLDSGCVCCTIRGELADALRDLFSRRQRGELPAFRRVVLETTGLAEPAPILATLAADPVIRHHFRLGGVVTVVDALNALETHRHEPVWAEQLSAADQLVLTKTDLVPAARAQQVRAQLAALNPLAPVTEACDDVLPIDEILPPARVADGRLRPVTARKAFYPAGASKAAGGHRSGGHLAETASFCLEFDRQIDWTAFGLWLSLLLNRHGRNILRVKGLLHIEGSATPVAIQGVQHVVHPPTHLSAWPDDERRSRLVFITRGLDARTIEHSCAVFLRCLPV